MLTRGGRTRSSFFCVPPAIVYSASWVCVHAERSTRATYRCHVRRVKPSRGANTLVGDRARRRACVDHLLNRAIVSGPIMHYRVQTVKEARLDRRVAPAAPAQH